MSRRLLLSLPGAAALPLAARAQAWPSRPLTLIVPFAAGGNVDTVARLAATELGRRLGQPVVVENAPGAGGTIGTERAARAAPDGHTLLLGVESPLAIAPAVTPAAVRYDPLTDFAALGMLASLPLVLLARPNLPARNLPEFLDLGRRQVGGLTYGTSGTGTSLHLWGETIAQRAGLRLEHVPYRIAAQIPPDLIAGRLDLAVLSLTTARPLLRDGRVRGLAVSSAQPHPAIPEVPPLASLPVFAGLEMVAWQAVFAPATTPAAVQERLATELAAMLEDAGFRRQLDAAGMTPWPLPPRAVAALLREDAGRYAAIARAGGIRAD
ncbi:Bug family tripartite tricarboxylate transporter substrate binding protein [Roseococcus sp. DSY-14]|uniref:Bug family tripartite tricarboxylate transporter substrate binding protein n=1 Tax=Roseococcus sp. DSY-14 TaxID=3369650 RepID=UPI00387B8DCD